MCFSASQSSDMEKESHSDPRIHSQRRLLTPFLLDKTVPPIPADDERPQFPFLQRKRNFLNELFLVWCYPILKVGYRRTLDPNDMFEIQPGSHADVDTVTNRFYIEFKSKKDRYEKKYIKSHNLEDNEQTRKFIKSNPDFKYPSTLLLFSLLRSIKKEAILSVVTRAVAEVAGTAHPILIRKLIRAIHKGTDTKHVAKKGYGFAIGIALMILFQGLMFVANFHLGTFVGSEAKGILTKVLVDKSFKLSRQAKLKYSPSDITSLLGNDLSKIDMAAPYATIVIGLPISLIMTICLVGSYLGGAAISGIQIFLPI
ncbi:unnamed protein product [Ambrosiozyma monospora]|uniref:Unnamed protein product n=1 Tax=Ambrosiozyma monospora TaxID=43982 RepID=A0ACB5SZZ1_AMBMO|nr:unnamed protein product [Ambrosiozyma monospora]